LLVRERAELDSVAAPLRERRRVVAFLVCEAALRPAVLAYLRDASGVAVPEPVRMAEPGQVVDALVEAAAQGPGAVRSLLVEGEGKRVLEALNWNREKLRRGASVLVWIEGVEGLRALRAMAPDAYSFRDVMVMVRGEDLIAIFPAAEDTLEIQLARIPYQAADTPQERVQAAVHLAGKLLENRVSQEGRRLCLDILTALQAISPEAAWAKNARAEAYWLLATIAMHAGNEAQASRLVKRGLQDVANGDTSDERLARLMFFALQRSPLGVDRTASDGALLEILPAGEHPSIRGHVLLAAADGARERADLTASVRFLREAAAEASRPALNGAVFHQASAEVEEWAGRLDSAEQYWRAACAQQAELSAGTTSTGLGLARCYWLRGEGAAARRTLDGVLSRADDDVGVRVSARGQVARLHVEEGDVQHGLPDFRVLIHEAASTGRDGHLYDACSSYVSSLRAAHEARRLAPTDLTDADAELEVAQDISLSLCPDDDPPWYTILYPGLRADVLSLRPERLPDAITLAATALERARAVWNDAAPMHARMLIGHLVTAGRLEEARAALAMAEPEAEAQRHLRELARLRALAVTVLVSTGAPAAEVDAKLAALRATLDETGAPRIAAETLLELALLLPPATTHPEPLDLLDEAHALFTEMPIPAQEARCLEAMGDVLSARGASGEARRRYLAAQGTYEQYGLGLRLPLLGSKLERLSA
jgi:hypothetical protein